MPKHALKRESRYVSPLIDVNLPLSLAAFVDEHNSLNSHKQ